MEEESDAAAIFSGRTDEIERPEEAEWPEWSGAIRVAWQALRNDRHFGSMGGIGPIYYTAVSRYAEDLGLSRREFDVFLFYLVEMDAEYVDYCAEAEKARAERAKTNK